MNELLEVLKVVGLTPGPAALVIVVFLYFKNKESEARVAKANGTRYVIKEECHTHIDGLKAQIQDVKHDIKEVHEKINDTNKSVARIEGYLERKEHLD